MKFTSTIFIASLLVALTASAPQNPEATAPQRYIVKLRKGASQTKLISLLNNNSFKAAGNKVQYTYRPNFFNGFAGSFNQEFLAEIRKTYGRELEYIEKDGIMRALATFEQPSPPSWGLSRISSRTLNTSGPFIGDSNLGKGINVYVVDTGLNTKQKGFENAKLEKSFSKAEPTSEDGNGHGTHCAGTVGSTTYGVAKKANIFGVKVLNSAGSGTYADVIAGIEYVASKGNKQKVDTIMSMSLGGPKSQAVDDATNAAVAANVAVIVAAGNSNNDACTLSPAGAKDAFTVGATDNTDKRASYSSYGKCVEIFAPGSDITSLWTGADGATNKISGTSMATPHVAGVAALFAGEQSFPTVKDLYAALTKAATPNVVKNPGTGSPNLLLYSQNTPATRRV